VNIRKKWEISPLGRASELLTISEKRKLCIVVIVQVMMSGLDLVAIGIVGVLGSLTVSGVSSRNPGGKVWQILKLLNLDQLQFQEQAAFLGILATLLLVTRTVLSIFFSRRIMFFLSRRAATLSRNLLGKLLNQSLLFVQGRTSQQTLFALTQGVSGITLGIIGTAIAVTADISLIMVMLLGLFIVDPVISISMFISFGTIAFILYKVMHKKAEQLGNRSATLEVKSSEKIIEVIGSYRELIVRNRRAYYAEQIGKLRFDLADTQAELTFMPNISKYIMESTVVLGSLVFSAIQFITTDATHAVGTLAIFLTAGTRLAPAALRLQQGAIQLRSTMGSAGPTLDLIELLRNEESSTVPDSKIDFEHSGFSPNVQIIDVSVSYPGASVPAVKSATLDIGAGSSLAVVGASGAGKTTLVDTILGVLSPEFGDLKISGLKPLTAISKWPGAISYVPQDVGIISGNIIENITLGYSCEEIDEDQVWRALEIAQLSEFVKGLSMGLQTEVGERGTKLSGGQRQRLGLARAMYTNPKLLILDEATSALDGQTEFEVASAIRELRGKVTLIVIAHRLSTIRDLDQIAFMDSGEIKAVGTFEEVRKLQPEFNRQAILMGL
jgi:ABC-type multidrug transport system fused ATPase/permease subunit